MWIALEILGFWIGLSIVVGLAWGRFVSGGWRGIREDLAPSNVSEHGDLSEGR